MPEALADQKTALVSPKPLNSAWCAGLACFSFFVLSLVLVKAYGLLHWGIIGKNFRSLDPAIKTDLFSLLGFLEVYHVTALLSVAFGLRAFWGSPRWIRWVCLPLMTISFVIAFSLM